MRTAPQRVPRGAAVEVLPSPLPLAALPRLPCWLGLAATGFAAAVVLLLLLLSTPARAITINATYEVPDVSKPEIVRAFSQAEIDVIEAARMMWEARVDSPEVFDVSFAVVDLPGTRLGQANPDPADPSTGTPVGGRVLFDPRSGMGDKPFFVDPTPDEQSEYSPVPTGPPTAFAASDPASPAFDRFDLLTVAIHELGHILGISSSYGKYTVNVQPSPDTTQKVYAFASMAFLGDPVADYAAGVFFTDGGIYLPPQDEDPGEGGSQGGVPSHLDDFDQGGASAGLFALNVMNETLQTGERFLIADPELDVLADAYAYTVVPEPPAGLLGAVALTALAGLRRRRHRRPARLALAAVLPLALAFALPAGAAVPVVYDSPGDDGIDPGAPVVVPDLVQTTVHLYIDGGALPSTADPCFQGDGDEVCAFALTLTGQAGLDLVDFTAAGGTVSSLSGNVLQCNAIAVTGSLGPVKIGDLAVTGTTDGFLELSAGQSIDAALGTQLLSPATLVIVPEPGVLLALPAGLSALAALYHASRRRERGRAPGREPPCGRP